jgi:hypothetical protein
MAGDGSLGAGQGTRHAIEMKPRHLPQLFQSSSIFFGEYCCGKK